MNEQQQQEAFFYIQNKVVCGNSAVWWRHNRQGYSSDLSQAGKYTREECDSLCRPGIDRALPVEAVDALAAPHVDVQKLMEWSADEVRRESRGIQ